MISGRMIFPLQVAFLIVPLEVLQLVIAERMVGVKRIRSGADPRDAGDLSPALACVWLACLLSIYAYALLCLMSPETRGYGAALAAVAWLGYELRRRLPLRFTLVVLTFEGAIRIGVIINMFVADSLGGLSDWRAFF